MLDRAVSALANRKLHEGVGLIQWASMRREGGKMRATFYLAAEAYGYLPSRETTLDYGYVPEVPHAEVFQLTA